MGILDFLRGPSKQQPVETVTLERLRVHRLKCPICENVLEDGDVVVRRSGTPEADMLPLVHAKCGVRVKTPSGEIVGDDHPLAVIFTESMWSEWLSVVGGAE